MTRGISAGVHILEVKAWMFSHGETITVSNDLRESLVGGLAVKKMVGFFPVFPSLLFVTLHY